MGVREERKERAPAPKTSTVPPLSQTPGPHPDLPRLVLVLAHSLSLSFSLMHTRQCEKFWAWGSGGYSTPCEKDQAGTTKGERS